MSSPSKFSKPLLRKQDSSVSERNSTFDKGSELYRECLKTAPQGWVGTGRPESALSGLLICHHSAIKRNYVGLNLEKGSSPPILGRF